MPNLWIKNVPVSVLNKLRQRAKRNHRSLQGELLAIMRDAATDQQPPAHAAPGDGVRCGTKTVEQVVAEIRARDEQPDSVGPFAVDIIRAHRDTR